MLFRSVKSSLYEKSKTGDFVEVCQDMNIVSTLPEYTKPKNVGLMFFSMEPDKFFPYTQIDVVQFPSGLGGNDIIEKIFKGPIHQQLRDALQYIKNVIITEKVVKHPDRAEADRFFNFPMQRWKKHYRTLYIIVHMMNESQLRYVLKMTELKLLVFRDQIAL